MKGKIKKHISKHIFFYSSILIFFCIVGYGLSNIKLEASDEIYNFSNTYKLLNGIDLYSENNIIHTPLFFYLVSLIFKIVGANLLVFKIINIIAFEILIVIIIKILKKLDVPVSKSVIFILLTIFPFLKDLFVVGSNYNNFAMLFWIIGMNFIIKKDKLEVKVVEQGIISALMFATKQNIGIYYMIALTIFTIYNYRKEIKIALKKLAGIYIIFAFITGIWMVYLAINGQFYDFINYCFFGLSEFANKNLSVSWADLACYLIPFVLVIGVQVAVKKFGVSKESKLYKITMFFTCFMFVALLIGYPIFNPFHVKLALLPAMILMIYLGNSLINQMEELFKYKIIKVIIVVYIGIVIIVNIGLLFFYISILTNKDYELNYNDAFYGTYLSEEYKNKFTQIKQFIQEKEAKGQDVIIFFDEANLYEVPLKRHKKDFNLPFLGNWGYKGEERITNEIRNFSNTYIIIKDENRTGQESEKVKEIIKNEYEKVGNISEYEIFYKE